MEPREILVNNELYGIHRGKINANFLEIWTVIIAPEDVLLKTNSTPYTPTNAYHPATKAYADSLETNWQAVYNPQSIAGDVFLRSNHTGDMPAVNVTQDTENRFVSDTEKAAWSAKEDAIGAKNTAFNQNYGTTPGTVATGDHLHNEYEPKNTNIQTHIATTSGNPHAVNADDLGLADVDNTSDLDKPVSTATQTALDLKQNTGVQAYRDYTTGATDPSHLEGRVYYDDFHKALSVMGDVSGQSTQLGQETLIRFINKSGSTISNGAALRFGGYDTTTTLPVLILAQADTTDGARMGGLATADVANNAIGFCTNFGVVHGLDTSAYSDGTRLYLSPTVAGGWTDTVPDVITRIGAVLNADATEGTIFVNLNTNVALPNTYAMLEGMATPPTLTTSFQTLLGFTDSDAVADTANTTTGVIVPNASGKYRVTGNLTCSFNSISSGSRLITIEIWDQTESAQEYVTTITVPKDSGSGSRSFSRLLTVHATDEYVMRIKADASFSNFVVDDVSFDITSINTR